MGVKISDLSPKGSKIASTDLIEVAVVSGGGYVSRSVTGSQINEVSLDTTPQLGGDLDVNGQAITSSVNGNVIITPNGTGHIAVGFGSTNNPPIRFYESSANGTNSIGIKAPATLTADSTYTLPTADGTSGQVLSTNGSGTLSWANNDSGLTVNSTAIALGTAGRVFFQNASNQLSQSANLFWDNTNNRLGINTATPTQALDVSGNARIGNRSLNAFIALNRTDTSYIDVAKIITNGHLQIGGTNVGIISFTGSSSEFGRFNGSNFVLGGTSVGTSSDKVLAQYTGTAPGSSPADAYQQYSADITAGNAAPHFRTENGNVVKLYQETTGVAAATFVANTSAIVDDTATFDGYTIGQVVKALKNLGILA
jgi:hypothetical protein